MQEQILKYLSDRPYINASGLERAAGVPPGTIRRAKAGIDPIPAKHIPALLQELRRVGFEDIQQNPEKIDRI